MSEKKAPEVPPVEKPEENPGIQIIPIPETRQRRILMLNAEIASMNARLHEHLAIICEDNAVDASEGAVFSPDLKTVIVSKRIEVPTQAPPKLEPE